MKLDTRSEIFQNLNGAVSDLSIFNFDGDLKILNKLTMTVPACIHANGPTKVSEHEFLSIRNISTGEKYIYRKVGSNFNFKFR